MEAKPINSNVDYRLLSTVEGEPIEEEPSTTKQTRTTYPGNRRHPVTLDAAPGPPPNMVLIPTAGNALQAVDKSILENSDKDSLMAVSVPENTSPGTSILITTPNDGGRTIQACIPEGALPGHTFFVQIPPYGNEDTATAQATPVEAATPSSCGTTQVVQGHDIHADLYFQTQVSSPPGGSRPSDVEMQQRPTEAGTSGEKAPKIV